MTWRIHLTNQAIQSIHFLHGNPSLVSAWSRWDRVGHYLLESGVLVGEQVVRMPEGFEGLNGPVWQNFISTLKAPNDVFFPVVQFSGMDIYLTEDGKIRLYHTGGANLQLQDGEGETQLDPSDAVMFMSVALDRLLGLSAALDIEGRLHVFQQRLRVDAFELSLKPRNELRSSIAISRGGAAIFVTDGETIVQTNSRGVVHKHFKPDYAVRLMACSPNGHYLVTSDMDTGIIRVYSGKALHLSHQRFAIDLVSEAKQLQLLADLPPTFIAPSALTISDEGEIAFAMGGVICFTDLSHMNVLPGPETEVDKDVR
jgi:hypothetical protein